MPICRDCGGLFQWGLIDGKWVLLEPTETQRDLDRSYVDENGELRADHRDRHGPLMKSVNVERLTKKIKAADAPQPPPASITEKVKSRTRRKKAA